MLTLNSPIKEINRIGAATAGKLRKLGIATIEDMIFYFPFRYDDFTRLTPIADLKIGQSANIIGQIELIKNKRSHRRRMYITEALVSDETESVKVIWFNQPYIARNLRIGDWVSLAGKVDGDITGACFKSPVYEKIPPLSPLVRGAERKAPFPLYTKEAEKKILQLSFRRGTEKINPPNPLYAKGEKMKIPLTSRLAFAPVKRAFIKEDKKEEPPYPPCQGGRYGEVGAYRVIHTQGLVPNYHLTANLTHKQLRFLISQVIGLANKIIDWLPEGIIRRLKLLKLNIALKNIHFSKKWEDVNEARRRLAFNELFLIQLQSQIIRRDAKSCVSTPIKFFEAETKEFVNNLPFKLTDAQRRVAWDILKDIGQTKPMARLLEGDVGSGKTIVALIAMLNCALNNKKAVIMVPTEILANQHFNLICKLLEGFNINIGLVTRSDKKLNYESEIMNNSDGENKNKKIHNSKFIIHNSNIIIGTHALIHDKIKFKDLVLAVIDEQHRFGVEQRKMLMEKSGHKKAIPHLLSMTATPIPRSLALALYGDLDISIINQMPLGRKKIITKVVAENNRNQAYAFIREQIKSGRQVFVICPLIDVSDPLRLSYSEASPLRLSYSEASPLRHSYSEASPLRHSYSEASPLRLSYSEASKLGVKSVKEEYKKLDEIIFPDLPIGMLHGRMKAREKEGIMKKFLDNKIKILVATSVVEVGVDVPNASIMMIEGADRFGLAQLHQFRGRVGRSVHQSYCFLFTNNQSEKTLMRLKALIDNFDGFSLAKEDLKFRGPGEVYGTAQKGFPELKIATLFDYELMKMAKEEAERLLEKDGSLSVWPALKEELSKKEKIIHLE